MGKSDLWDVWSSRFERARMAFGVGFGLGVFIPWVILFLGRQIRRWLGPGDSLVLLWWPEDAWHTEWLMRLGTLWGVAIFGYVLLKGVRKRPLALAAALTATLAVTSSALSWTTSTRLYADRIETRAGLFSRGPRLQSLPLASVPYVSAYCFLPYQRARAPQKRDARLAYVIPAPDHEHGADLMSGAVPHGAPYPDPLAIVRMLDGTVLRDTPRSEGRKGRQECFDRFREQVSASEFAAMLTIMRIDEQTFLRNYARPSEQWNRRLNEKT